MAFPLTGLGSCSVNTTRELVDAVARSSCARVWLISTEYNLTDALNVSRDVDIASFSGSAALRGSGAHRVLYVASKSAVTLSGLVLFGGNASGRGESVGPETDGGGIYNDGELTLRDSTLMDNFAANVGGSLYNRGTATISNTTFRRSNAVYGGGVCNDGDLRLISSIFQGINNSAVQNGAIRNNRPNINATMLISHCTMVNGDSRQGSGIDNNAILIVNQTIISGNIADDNGAGLSSGGNITLLDSTVTHNHATNQYGSSNRYGGGIAINGGVAVIRRTLVADNFADGSGGTGASGGGGVFNGGNLTIVESTIVGNNATASGGGIFNSNITTLLRSTIANNSAATGGGLFSGTGGVYPNLTIGATTIVGSIVVNNTASWSGGGAYIYVGSILLDSTPRFINNSAPAGCSIANQDGKAEYRLPAPAGYYMNGSLERVERDGVFVSLSRIVDKDIPFVCPRGHWCNGSKLLPCPPGKRGNGTTFNSSECGGDCPPGFYCPESSTAPLVCKPGTFSESGAGKGSCPDCLPGKWCAAGEAFDCPLGTFSSAPHQERIQSCLPCPFNTTTLAEGTTNASMCVCQSNFFDDLGRDPTNATFDDGARTCAYCPLGFNCPAPATTTRTAVVASGFWRPYPNATRAKPCPITGTCVGRSISGDALCATGFHGTYCIQCDKTSMYLDSLTTECRSCRQAQAFYGRLLLILLVALAGFILVLGCAASLRARLATPRAERMSCGSVWRSRSNRAVALLHLATLPIGAGWRVLKAWARRVRQTEALARLSAAAEHVGLRSKLKICLGLYLVLAQLGDVYQIRYPPKYQSISKTLFAPLRQDFLSWIPGLHLGCFGVSGIIAKLAFYICFPMAVGLLACGASLLASRSVRPVLPFLLFWTYFVFPSVSSQGFQAIAQCDCFDITNGHGTTDTLLCYLPADYSYTCPTKHAGHDVIALGVTAIIFYGIGVPVVYARLLYMARADIRSTEPPPSSLAPSLSFLHGALLPDALWWPLVDTSRTLLLTGVLALIEPGELIQIFCGVTVAVCYLALQIWISPFRMPGNNLLSLGTNLALVLNLLSSLGVQFNAKYNADAIHPYLLTVILFIAGSAVLLATLLTLCAALSRRLTPEQLRQYLLAEVGTEGCSSQSVAPLVARFGEYTLSADQLAQAISAPVNA